MNVFLSLSNKLIHLQFHICLCVQENVGLTVSESWDLLGPKLKILPRVPESNLGFRILPPLQQSQVPVSAACSLVHHFSDLLRRIGTQIWSTLPPSIASLFSTEHGETHAPEVIPSQHCSRQALWKREWFGH